MKKIRIVTIVVSLILLAIELYCLCIKGYLGFKTIDRIFILGVSFVCAMFAISITTTIQDNDIEYKNHKFINLQQFIECRESWKVGQVIFIYFHFLLVETSLGASTIAFYIDAANSKTIFNPGFYIIISIMLTVIDCLFNPSKISIGYREAFEIIDIEINRYLNGLCTEADLINAKARGEKEISNKMC